MALLITSVAEDWGESSSNRRRKLSSQPSDHHSSTEKRSLRVGAFLPDPQTTMNMISVVSNASDADTDSNVPRRLSSSVSWPSYLSVPGEAVLTLCPGHTLDVSMCSTSLDSNIACSGDPLIEVLNPVGTFAIASSNDYCGLCPSLLHTVPASTSCSDYVLKASCNSGSCGGKALLTVTTSTCSQTFPATLSSSSSNAYPVLSCSLLQFNQDSLSNIEGQWTVMSGGSVRDQCELRGSGYGGSSYSSSWSSTASNRRFYFCAKEEEDQFSVSLLAGAADGSSGTSNGIGTNVQFYYPLEVSLSSDDSYALVADSYNHMIRKIVMSTSAVSLLAGSTGVSYGTSNGIGTNAQFYHPRGVSLSSEDSYALVADSYNHMIRKIVMSTSAVSSVAGSTGGSYGTSNGIGTNAQFWYPRAVSLSSDDSYALVADSYNHMIRKIVMSTSAVSLLAGSMGGLSGTSNGIGTSARFNVPAGVSLSSDDSYALVADSYNHMIRKIVMSTSAVSLVAGAADGSSGSSNGIGTNARFYNPSVSLSSDDSYALVPDYSNHMIRKIVMPSVSAVITPTRFPTRAPTPPPSLTPTPAPSLTPTAAPSLTPTRFPTRYPTRAPTWEPTGAPTLDTAISHANLSPFLPDVTTGTASASLVFIILALLLVFSRMLLTTPQLPSSCSVGPAGRPLKLFAAWWWVGYLCCCGFSAVCAVAAVASYAEALSQESRVSPPALSSRLLVCLWSPSPVPSLSVSPPICSSPFPGSILGGVLSLPCLHSHFGRRSPRHSGTLPPDPWQDLIWTMPPHLPASLSVKSRLL
jgi:dihydroxyacetone kinase DhaKLM complex PTS-EIIA-like component DhaM